MADLCSLCCKEDSHVKEMLNKHSYYVWLEMFNRNR